MENLVIEIHNYIDEVLIKENLMLYDYETYNLIQELTPEFKNAGSGYNLFLYQKQIQQNLMQLADILEKFNEAYKIRLSSYASSVEFLNSLIKPDPNETLPEKIKNIRVYYEYIAITKRKEIAAKLRQKIAAPTKRNISSTAAWMVQKHGLVPISDFQSITPPSHATIIRIKAYSYFNSSNMFKKVPDCQGISPSFPVVKLIKVETRNVSMPFITVRSRIIYETYDDKHYRQLKTSNYKKLGTISEIAQGYQNALNSAFKPDKDKLLFTDKNTLLMRAQSMYSGIYRIIQMNELEENFTKFYKAYYDVLVPKIELEKMEFEIGIKIEYETIKKRARQAKSKNEFINEVANDQKSFIVNFLTKRKIFQYFLQVKMN